MDTSAFRRDWVSAGMVQLSAEDLWWRELELRRNEVWIVPDRNDGASVPEWWRLAFMCRAIWVNIQPKVNNIAVCLLAGKCVIPPALMLLPASCIFFGRTSKWHLHVDDLAVLSVCLAVYWCRHMFWLITPDGRKWIPNKLVFVVYSFCNLPVDRSIALPKGVLRILLSSASSLKFQYILFSVKSSRICVRLLPRIPVTYTFPSDCPSITCFRRQFLSLAGLPFRLLLRPNEESVLITPFHLCFSLPPGLLHEMYWCLVLSIRSLIPARSKREEVRQWKPWTFGEFYIVHSVHCSSFSTILI